MCLSHAPALADNGAMTNQALVPAEIAARYEVHEWRNGLAILTAAHPEEWANLLEVLRDFVLLKSDVLKPGGSKGLKGWIRTSQNLAGSKRRSTRALSWTSPSS